MKKPSPQPKQSGFAHTGFIVLLLVLAIAGLIGWRVWEVKNGSKTKIAEPSSERVPAKVDAYSGWGTYTSKRGGFTLRYPEKWQISGFQGEAFADKDTLTGEETMIRFVHDEDSQNEFGMSIDLTAAPPAYYGEISSGTTIKLGNGLNAWVSKQQDPKVAGRAGVCPVLQFVSDQGFVATLANGTYLTLDGSFCWNQKSNPSYNYEQQINSSSFEEAKKILASITVQ